MKNSTFVPDFKRNPRNRNNKLEIKGNFFNLKKGIYKEPATNIILIAENLCAFPVRSAIRIECLILLFNIILEVLTNATTQEKKKRNSDWEGRKKATYV